MSLSFCMIQWITMNSHLKEDWALYHVAKKHISHWCNNQKPKIISEATEPTVPNILLVVYPGLIGSSKVPYWVNTDSREVACTVSRPWALPTTPTSCHLSPQTCCGVSKSHKAQWIRSWKSHLKATHAVHHKAVNLSTAGKGKGQGGLAWTWGLNKSRCFESQ